VDGVATQLGLIAQHLVPHAKDSICQLHRQSIGAGSSLDRSAHKRRATLRMDCLDARRYCPAPHKKKAPRVLHHAEPETERRIGAGGRRGPPLVYCLKQDRGDLVPVDRVKNKRGSTAVKKPQQNHHA
jgi:hypothetical protein